MESIFYSSDGGENWARKKVTSDLPVYNILQSPLDEDEVIIGTELEFGLLIILALIAHLGDNQMLE